MPLYVKKPIVIKAFKGITGITTQGWSARMINMFVDKIVTGSAD